MESIMTTDMIVNATAWCSLQDQNSTDWRERCRFFLCTCIQTVSSILSYNIDDLNKDYPGQNVKNLSTDDLQNKSEHKEREPAIAMLYVMIHTTLCLFHSGHINERAIQCLLICGHTYDCAVRATRTRWLFWLSYVAVLGSLCLDIFVLYSTWTFRDGYKSISLLLGFDSRALIIPSCYVAHLFTNANFLEVDGRCNCSSQQVDIYTDTWTTIYECILFLRRHGAQTHHSTRPEPHTWSKQVPSLQPNCSRSNENDTDVSAEISSSSSRSSSPNTGSRGEDTCDDSDPADAWSCFASKAKDTDVSAEVLTDSGRSSSPDAGSLRRESGDDSFEDALSCLASPKANYSDGKEEVSPNSSRSSSPDTYSRGGYTGDVDFATKANSSDGDEADVSADTTPAGSRSSSPDTRDDRGRCTCDDIPTDATVVSWISSPPSTYDDKGKREVPAKEDFASENSSSADSDLQQEDVSGSLQETASLCSSRTFRPIRHDGGQGCGPRTTHLAPGQSSPVDDFQVGEETDENMCSSRRRAIAFCSPLIPCTETNSRTEDKPHSVVPDSSGDSRRSSASVVPNCGSDYASDSGSSGESIFTVTKNSMGIKSCVLPFDSRSVSALLETKCERDCTSGSSDDSIFKGNECSMALEKGIDKLLKRRPLSTRTLIGKRPSGLESALNVEFSKRRKLNESDSGDSIL